MGNLRWLQPLLHDLCDQPHWRKLMYRLSETCDKSYFLDQIIKTVVENGGWLEYRIRISCR